MKKTIKDIAKESGFSTATVSKILNHKDFDISEQTREKVLDIVNKYNFQLNRAARSLVSKVTKTIGLLLPDVSNPFFADIAKGAEDAAFDNGYNVFLCNSHENFEKELSYLKSMIQLNVDGILLIGVQNANETISDNFILPSPIVTIDRDSCYSNIRAKIQTDHYKGACDAMQYLLNCGHRNILFIAGPKSSDSAQFRKKAYFDVMHQNHIEINPDEIKAGSFSIEHGFETVLSIPDIQRYTAIFCCNDLIAIGAIAGLKKLSLQVPEDISIISIDDINLARITTPPLTTMNQGAYHLGQAGCEALIKIIHDEKIDPILTIDQKMVIRKSVKKLFLRK
ncbi:MAG: LacI family DNA-binding transcriptional regulator [Peptoniphilaceae bacterium]|nr:LacI family DNA-binding transcriptional regulator [Peptoniphilaceae bacterium]